VTQLKGGIAGLLRLRYSAIGRQAVRRYQLLIHADPSLHLVVLCHRGQFVTSRLFGIANVKSVANDDWVIPKFTFDSLELCQFLMGIGSRRQQNRFSFFTRHD
jgi:hypothetical protein